MCTVRSNDCRLSGGKEDIQKSKEYGCMLYAVSGKVGKVQISWYLLLVLGQMKVEA